jgi:hypothetical protein
MTLVSNPNLRQRSWSIIASYVTVIGMILAFAMIMVQFERWLLPGTDIGNLMLVCAIITIESFLSYWLFKHLPTAQKQVGLYRGTEIVLLLVVLKFYAESRLGLVSFWNNFLLWPVHFPMNIINARFLMTIIPVFTAWYLGSLFITDLSLLGIDDPAQMDDRPKEFPVRLLIVKRFLKVGMFVIVLAAIPPQEIFQLNTAAASNAVPAVLVYFVLGTILLSLTRYASFETAWKRDKLIIPSMIPRRWFAYSALILVALVLIISRLPNRFELGLIATINAIFHVIFMAVLAIYGLIMFLFGSVLKLFLRNPPSGAIPIVTVTPPPTNLPEASPGVTNWQLFESILIWGLLAILMILAVRQYLAYNKDIADELRGFRPIKWLMVIWKRIWNSIKSANQAVGIYVQTRWKQLRSRELSSTRSGGWGFINPHRLSTRQKVIFYYLALVRRSGEAGFPRREEETPYEFANSLGASIKEERESLDTLTNSFIEARYSRHPIHADTANRTEIIWGTFRKVLRKIRNSHQKNP